MESYHDLMDKVDERDKPYRHLFGGYQLMQNLSLELAEQRLKKMAQLWFETKSEGPGPEGQRHVYHVEFGHFSSLEHFKLFEKYAVSNADSLGMNEVEVQMLLDYWSGNLVDINEERQTQPSLQIVLELTDEMFRQAQQK